MSGGETEGLEAGSRSVPESRKEKSSSMLRGIPTQPPTSALQQGPCPWPSQPAPEMNLGAQFSGTWLRREVWKGKSISSYPTLPSRGWEVWEVGQGRTPSTGGDGAGEAAWKRQFSRARRSRNATTEWLRRNVWLQSHSGAGRPGKELGQGWEWTLLPQEQRGFRLLQEARKVSSPDPSDLVVTSFQLMRPNKEGWREGFSNQEQGQEHCLTLG